MTKKDEKQPEEPKFVVKAYRYSGGYSIIDITTKEKAEELAAEFNFQYHTDNYKVEPYKPSDEYGAPHENSDHRKS
jgi:hypothetical protein